MAREGVADGARNCSLPQTVCTWAFDARRPWSGTMKCGWDVCPKNFVFSQFCCLERQQCSLKKTNKKKKAWSQERSMSFSFKTYSTANPVRQGSAESSVSFIQRICIDCLVPNQALFWAWGLEVYVLVGVGRVIGHLTHSQGQKIVRNNNVSEGKC